MRQEDFPESFERRLLPGNRQNTIACRLDIVCRFGRPCRFAGPQPDRQPITVNVDAIDKFGDCAVTCYGRGRHLSEVTSRSNWAKDNSTLSVSRPMEVVVLNCWVTETKELVGNGFDELLEERSRRRCIVSKRLRLQRHRPPRPRASLNRREEIFAETIDSRAHFQWRTQLQWRHRWLSSLRLR